MYELLSGVIAIAIALRGIDPQPSDFDPLTAHHWTGIYVLTLIHKYLPLFIPERVAKTSQILLFLLFHQLSYEKNCRRDKYQTAKSSIAASLLTNLIMKKKGKGAIIFQSPEYNKGQIN
jgi:hypothetical protein